MGLSNYIASSRISQSGVCTSSTRPASPYEGQVIYETDTDRVLVWNASAWVAPNSQTSNPPGLELVSSQNFTTSDPLDLTGIFNANYTNYRLNLTYFGSVATNLNMNFFSGTNTLFSGNAYFRYGYSVNAGGITNRTVATSTTLNVSIHQTSSAQQTSVEMMFFHPNSNSQRKYMYSQFFDAQTGDAYYLQNQIVDNTAFTGLRFDAASGSITGTIRVYGYRN